MAALEIIEAPPVVNEDVVISPLEIIEAPPVVNEDVVISPLEIQAEPTVIDEVAVLRNYPRRIIFVIVLPPALGFLIYLALINLLFSIGSVEISKIGIQGVEYVNFEIPNKTTISLKATISLRVQLKKKRYIQPSPELGDFYLENQAIMPVNSSAKSSFQMSENEQLLVLKFARIETDLPEDYVERFQKFSRKGRFWFVLYGDIKWHVKHKRLMLITDTERHMYFKCYMPAIRYYYSSFKVGRCWT